MRVGHISDIHIRNVRHHAKYRSVFEALYESLEAEEPDIICVVGDVAHTKETLSAEYFEMASDFIWNLQRIALTIVTPGNHDANLANLRRQDAISPLVKNMRAHRVSYLKKSQRLTLTELGVEFSHLSLFDENWEEQMMWPDNEHVHIALFHGPVSGCETDAGFKMEDKLSLSTFDKFDFTMLGDIHKRQSFNDGRVWYPGSLIQQDYSEHYEKGYLIWDIEDADTWANRFVPLPNPDPFVTVTVSADGTEANHPEPPKGCHARFVITDDLSDREIDEAISPWITKIRPKDRRIVRRVVSSSARTTLDHRLNYRDSVVQKKLLKEFCDRKGASIELTERVIEIHEEVLAQVAYSDDLARNVIFDVERIEWDNLFSYGNDNALDLGSKRGVVGIFGPNATGKSSIVDSMLLAAFNNTSRRIPSPAYAVNNRRSVGEARLLLRSGETEYAINRSYTWKASNAKDATERGKATAKVTITENGEDISSKHRPATDKEVIRPTIGSIDDYTTTSVSPQGQIHRFISMTESPRKDYLINILDLGFFDEQLKIAKKLAAPVKAKVGGTKTASGINAIIAEKREAIVVFEAFIKEELDLKIVEVSALAQDAMREMDKLLDTIDRAHRPKYDMSKVQSKLVAAQKQKEEHEAEIATLNSRMEELLGVIEDAVDLSAYLQDEPEVLQEQLDKLYADLGEHRAEKDKLNKLKAEIAAHRKLSQPLAEVPCGDEFRGCKFIKNAHVARGELTLLEQCLPKDDGRTIEMSISDITSRIEVLEGTLRAYADECDELGAAQDELEAAGNKCELASEKLVNVNERIALINDQLSHAKAEQELTANLAELHDMVAAQEKAVELLDQDLGKLESDKRNKLIAIGQAEKEIEKLEEEKEHLRAALAQAEAYDLALEGLSRNGLVQQILEEIEPAINAEINAVLEDVVDFEVKFDLRDPKFRIYLEQTDRPRRHIELASGFERMVSSLAIRVALIKLSTLPKLSTLVIDEGFGTLDEEHRISIGRLFDSLKTSFRNILIISHIDSIKDMADHIVSIEVGADGFSHVQDE